MTKSTTTTKRTKKIVQLSEFRAWLEGVEELQDKSWHPDAKQWKLIRRKIDSVVCTQNTMQQSPLVTDSPVTHRAVIPATSSLLSTVTPTNTNTIESIAPISPKTPDIDTSTGNYDSQYT
jgi:hypothetical protein